MKRLIGMIDGQVEVLAARSNGRWEMRVAGNAVKDRVGKVIRAKDIGGLKLIMRAKYPRWYAIVRWVDGDLFKGG